GEGEAEAEAEGEGEGEGEAEAEAEAEAEGAEGKEEAEEKAERQPAAAAAGAAGAQAKGDGAPAKPAGAGAGRAPEGNGGPGTAEERLRQRSTPLVRRIAAEHGVDIGQIEGTGHAGRVTKQDILSFIDRGGAAPKKAGKPAAAEAGTFSVDQLWDVFYGKVRHPEFPVREADRVEPMDRMRKLTADHMVRAKRIAPHVHSFIEIDFTAVDRVRNANKRRWEEKQGVKVSFTAFVAFACARVLPEFPMVNGTVSGDNLIFRGNINIGIAVDLDPGLIVPVIHDADDLALVGIAKRINDLAARARDRKLKPDEIQGATFSITNPGVLGTLVGMPVIPEGTSAILGTGAIEKRPVVIEAGGTDTLAIRKRALFSLGYDHRIVDGADAARFLSRLKTFLEDFPSGE
ncbi:MAG: dihydrolipoamide acetyltransferase family protein, partial [Longimicrobiales bacterium]